VYSNSERFTVHCNSKVMFAASSAGINRFHLPTTENKFNDEPGFQIERIDVPPKRMNHFVHY